MSRRARRVPERGHSDVKAQPVCRDDGAIGHDADPPRGIGHGYWHFAAPTGKTGVWAMVHEARTDFSMWLSCLFLLIVGAGPRSLDARLVRSSR